MEMNRYDRMDKLGMTKNDLIGEKIVIDLVGDPFLVKDTDNRPSNVCVIYIDLPDQQKHLSFMVDADHVLARDGKRMEGAKYVTIGTKDVGKQSPMFVWEAYKE